MDDQTMYIVVTANQTWGRAATIKEACANAGLTVETAIDFFSQQLELADSLREVYRDWLEWGKAETIYHDGEKVAIVIVTVDPELWCDWEVSPFDGGVSLTPSDAAIATHGKEGTRKLYDQATVKAHWINGVIKPR